MVKIMNASPVVTAVVNKDQGEKSGLTVGKKNGKVVIVSITDGGLISKTDLRVGMEINTINNMEVNEVSTAEIGKLLLGTQGTMIILARQPTLAPGTLVTAVMTKKDPSESVGIGLGVTNEQVVITSIKSESMAYHTDLQAGMQLKSINNVACNNQTAPEVAGLLASATTTVTVLAQVPRTTVTSSVGRTAAGARPPPHGLPEGGQWVNRSYVGNATLMWLVLGCFCFGIFGPLALCCPCDERKVYLIDGKVYTADGEFIGREGNVPARDGKATATKASAGKRAPASGRTK